MNTRSRLFFNCLAFVLLVLVLAACQETRTTTAKPFTTSLPASSRPAVTTSSLVATSLPSPPQSTETAVRIPQTEGVPNTPVAATPALAAGIPITAENAASLQPLVQRDFGPWNQVLRIAWAPYGSSIAISAGEQLNILEPQSLKNRLDIAMGSVAPDIAYSPDGKNLAAIDRDGVLRVWDAQEGKLLQSLQAHQKSGSSVVYRPDGSLLASAGYDAMSRLWDLSSWEQRGEMIGGTFAVPAIAFTPDGASLAIVNGNIIRLRDVASTRFMRTLAAENPVYTIAFSPDGRRLASGDVANTIQVWDMAAEARPEVEIRESLQRLPVQSVSAGGFKALVWQVAFSPDGSMLGAASGDGRIRIWEAESGKLLAELSGHSQAATSLAFSPDGRWLASGGLDGRAILWGIR